MASAGSSRVLRDAEQSSSASRVRFTGLYRALRIPRLLALGLPTGRACRTLSSPLCLGMAPIPTQSGSRTGKPYLDLVHVDVRPLREMLGKEDLAPVVTIADAGLVSAACIDGHPHLRARRRGRVRTRTGFGSPRASSTGMRRRREGGGVGLSRRQCPL